MAGQTYIGRRNISGCKNAAQLVKLVARCPVLEICLQERLTKAIKGVPPLWGHGRYHQCQTIPHRLRDPFDCSAKTFAPDVAVVSAEDLVTAIAGERHCHVAARQLGERIS